jgi:arabinoxylan arabinofuranohydrolase
MYKKLFLTAALIAACASTNAQSIATDYKGSGNNNPLSANVFCADPTALEYNGRLYVYGSNDHQEFMANNKKNDNTYGNIKSIVVFSTDDMVNWTFHGTIDTKKICSSWTNNPWYVGYGVSWAPSVTWRHNETTDKDEFFLYFCNSSHGVGVLKAESPIGPWKSPNNKLMITYDTPGANKQGTNANFDPGVMIDDNGVGWITFGGLGSNGIMPDAARIIKLKPSMTAVDGKASIIHAPYHFEANELNYIGGKYVYTYCSNWANRDNTEWENYKQEHGITVNAPGGGTMCYMVSDNPLDPDSWVFKGYYGPGVAGNNHSHLQKFQGSYYHIYHNHGDILLNPMKNDGAIDASAGDYRSICVNKATVNESTATVSLVTLNTTGVKQIKNLNPYELQQIETMASSGGVNYEDFTNITKNTKISTLGNDASENMQVKMKPSSWVSVRKVDFGTKGAVKFTLRAKGTGKMELRTSSSPRSSLLTVDFSSEELEDHTFDIPADKLDKFKSVKNNLYLIITEGDNVVVDSWKFIEEGAAGIHDMECSEAVTTQRYDLSGRKLSGSNNHHGIIIEQYIDKNGVKHSRKRF